MTKRFFFAVLGLVAGAAQAAGTATIVCSGNTPVVQLSYSTGSDAGQPGLVWVGALSPNGQVGAVLTMANTWAAYSGGLYPPYRRFDGGLSGVITATLPLPPDAAGYAPTNTAHLQGSSVYVAHGVLTPQAQQQVAARRAFLESVKPQRQAAGQWRREYEDDTQFMWSLVQKNMVDGGKYGAVLAVPMVDCAPQQGGGL